jgi:hypothetical protein
LTNDSTAEALGPESLTLLCSTWPGQTQKEFKRIAMRADKTDYSFAAMLHLAAAVIASG